MWWPALIIIAIQRLFLGFITPRASQIPTTGIGTAVAITALAGGAPRNAYSVSLSLNVTSGVLNCTGGNVLIDDPPGQSVVTVFFSDAEDTGLAPAERYARVQLSNLCYGLAYCGVRYLIDAGDYTGLTFILPTGATARGDSDNRCCSPIASLEVPIKIEATFSCYKPGLDAIGSNAGFLNPDGIAISPDGSHAFVADNGGDRIRKISIGSTEVTTLAYSASSRPSSIAIDKSGAFALVTDSSAGRIRNISLSTGQGQIFAGGGTVVNGGIGTYMRIAIKSIEFNLKDFNFLLKRALLVCRTFLVAIEILQY